MNAHLEQIRAAYDLTVEQHNKGIDPFESVPEEFRRTPFFKALSQKAFVSCSSAASENKKYLDPKPGMRFLDSGCAANLMEHRLDRWGATYYGVDISSKLINACQKCAERNNIAIGEIYETDIANLPFDDNFFDICSLIGVLEYCTLGYTRKALEELHRVLKPDAKMVVDIPNLEHPYVHDMFALEQHLGRPNIPKTRTEFEEILSPFFLIDRVNDSQLMLKYFVRIKK